MVSSNVSLVDVINTSDEVSDEPMDKAAMRWKQIEKFLETSEFIMNADVRALCGISAVTANRVLAGLVTTTNLINNLQVDIWHIKKPIIRLASTIKLK